MVNYSWTVNEKLERKVFTPHWSMHITLFNPQHLTITIECLQIKLFYQLDVNKCLKYHEKEFSVLPI